jgi:hypothetical protein
MAVIDVTAANVRPTKTAIIRRFIAGGTINVGDAVYVASTGRVAQADADDQTQCQAIGIVVAVGVLGKNAAAAGDPVDVVTTGAVELGNVTAMTPGGVVYVSPTAGKLDQSASATTGDFNFIIGRAHSGDILYVHPQTAIPSAV